MLQAIIAGSAGAHPWSALPQIVFINVLLSADNALIIAMACRRLPRRQRIFGLAIGETVAVILLIVFAGVMTRLLQLPYLKLAGGMALLYIAARMLVSERTRTDTETVTQLWRAVRIVVLADLIMSFDNVLAIVQIAGGDLALLVIGLAVSIPIVVAGAALIAALLARLPVLIWAGSILLGWVAGQAMAGDAAITGPLSRVAGERLADTVGFAAGCAGAVLVVAIGGLWRRRRISRARCRPAADGRTR